jgi:methylated-DNA-protein-cysteine methyltransferase-like protein
VNSDFFKNVYEVVKLIPPGKVSSYGAIAKYLGTNKSARVVGWAMNNSHHDPSIPAHRVVNRNGLLTGKHHFPDEKTMEDLLKKEGILVRNNRIENFTNVFWDPIKELDI